MDERNRKNEEADPAWSGKSRGGSLGYRFFIALISIGSLPLVYFFIRPVALFYLLFTPKSHMWFYFRKIHGYGLWKSLGGIYGTFCRLGEVLVDKVAMLSGKGPAFSFDFDGEEHLRSMSEKSQGGLLIGAHMGNWEVAGQLLERIDTPVNIVMLEAEHESIRDVLEKVMVKRKLRIIPQKEDYSHLFLIKEALERKEFVVMHSDRFLPGSSTLPMSFMGKEARFPTGPLYLASKEQVPVSFVFTLKEGWKHYHFYATPPRTYAYPSRIRTRKQDLALMLADYVSALEEMLRKYPRQWFNFFPFWEEESRSA